MGIGLLILTLSIFAQPFRKILGDISEKNSANASIASPQIDTNSHNSPTPSYQKFDVIIYGDEVPGICAGIWAKKALGSQGKVVLVRPNYAQDMLGGLLTRGGLAYLDLDKISDWSYQPYAQCFKEFLKRADVVESCIEPQPADYALRSMLAEAGIEVISEAQLIPKIINKKIDYVQIQGSSARLKADSYIDTTQDAELARKAGLAYDMGYEGQNAKLKNSTLAVSVVPTIKNLTISELQKIEDEIVYQPELVNKIKKTVDQYQDNAGAEFWLKNFWNPFYQPYKDGYNIRSIALGATYHLENKLPFTQDKFFFDRANLCTYKNGDFSWNGFLFKYPTSTVIKLEENGRKIPPDMVKKMSLLQHWLQKYSQKDVRLILPEEIYVRHTLSIRDVVNPLTGQEILRGGTPVNQSIGSFSYDFDLRGGVKGLVLPPLPLPVFNFGIENTLASKIDNLAIVGRSSGYTGIAVSVGRILTLNIYQGQAVGVATAIAKDLQIPLNKIKSSQVRSRLERLTGETTYFYGKDTRNGEDFSPIK